MLPQISFFNEVNLFMIGFTFRWLKTMFLGFSNLSYISFRNVLLLLFSVCSQHLSGFSITKSLKQVKELINIFVPTRFRWSSLLLSIPFAMFVLSLNGISAAWHSELSNWLTCCLFSFHLLFLTVNPICKLSCIWFWQIFLERHFYLLYHQH